MQNGMLKVWHGSHLVLHGFTNRVHRSERTRIGRAERAIARLLAHGRRPPRVSERSDRVHGHRAELLGHILWHRLHLLHQLSRSLHLRPQDLQFGQRLPVPVAEDRPKVPEGDDAGEGDRDPRAEVRLVEAHPENGDEECQQPAWRKLGRAC